jgi:hypothetical protein
VPVDLMVFLAALLIVGVVVCILEVRSRSTRHRSPRNNNKFPAYTCELPADANHPDGLVADPTGFASERPATIPPGSFQVWRPAPNINKAVPERQRTVAGSGAGSAPLVIVKSTSHGAARPKTAA